MLIEIKNRYTDNVIYACEAENMREAVIEAVRNSDADLNDANLRDADLRDADLSGAYLMGANLRDADLSDADLSGAYLSGADLSRADLSGADLSGADLSGANLRGEKLAISPISILNLYWSVLITESYLAIGCQRHAHTEWKAFSDEDITEMHNKASEFWSANKSWLLSACKAHRKESLAFRKANPVEVTE